MCDNRFFDFMMQNEALKKTMLLNKVVLRPLTFPKILEALRDSRRTYIFIEEFVNCNEEAKYFSTFAKIDTDTSKDDIVLWFPKEQNGVFLKNFVTAHPLATYHSVIPWDQIV